MTENALRFVPFERGRGLMAKCKYVLFMSWCSHVLGVCVFVRVASERSHDSKVAVAARWGRERKREERGGGVSVSAL